jgi:hypothetical protein
MIEKLEKLIFGQKISKTIEIENRHRKVGRSKRTFLSQCVMYKMIKKYSFFPSQPSLMFHFLNSRIILNNKMVKACL